MPLLLAKDVVVRYYRHRAVRVMELVTEMTTTPRIEINPKVMLGKPVIRGTRITVELILRKLGEGATEQDLLAAYPHLTREDVQAVMTYAADTIAHEDMVLVESKA